MDVIKRIINYCPYTIAGKKILGKSGASQPVERKSTSPDDAEERFIRGIKMGRNISLIGFFCPLFWIALFMGASGSVILLNAVHSGLFMLLGGIYAFSNSKSLRKYRLKKVR